MKAKQILRSIRRIMRSTDLYSKRVALEYGVTVPQLVCLQALADGGEMPAGDLARAVDLSQSTCVGIVDRLEAKGWIERSRSTDDRRKILLRATAAGRELCARAPSLLQDTLASGLARLTEAEQSRIVEALERVVDMMRIAHIDAAPVLETGADLNGRDGKDSEGLVASIAESAAQDKETR